MRKIFGAMVLVAGLMVVGGRMAGAQLVDPTTGFTVDAATDPMDFSAVASGQPGNVGMEANASAMASMQATMNAQQSYMSSLNSSPMDSTTDDTAAIVTPPVPRLPATPKPVFTPNGGKFTGSVQVTISDSDAKAVVFYTTDGKKPTTSSARYAGPIVVSAKVKVRALAFDVNDAPSGVVSKTFKAKT